MDAQNKQLKERVQELERANKIVNNVGVNIIKDLEEENKRLREVIEGARKQLNDVNYFPDENIYLVNKILQQALEGDHERD